VRSDVAWENNCALWQAAPGEYDFTGSSEGIGCFPRGKNVGNRHYAQRADSPKDSADLSPHETAESRAKKKLRALWKSGDLFHVSTRYPRRGNTPRVDRLAGILTRGLVAPARCRDGSVHSDLHIVMTGSHVPYDSLVFLHRFGSRSHIYTICEPGRFAIFVDPAIPVLTPESMGTNWVELCQDEVYVSDQIALEKLVGVAIHPADADSVMSELLAEFRCSEIPLYDYDGNVLWPPG
jgi:hypothetical protein